eukprot:9293035-Prorocentrum_lima.AAC.1
MTGTRAFGDTAFASSLSQMASVNVGVLKVAPVPSAPSDPSPQASTLPKAVKASVCLAEHASCAMGTRGRPQ